MSNKDILIAKIISVYGIQGLLKVISYSEEPKEFVKYNPIFDKKKENYKLKIVTQTKNDNIFIVKVNKISDRNNAQLLVNTDLFITRKQLSKTNKDEFYYVDLIGLQVIDMKNKILGIVKNVYDFGAGGIIEVEMKNTKSKKGSLQNFSFNNDTVPEVNLDNNYLRLNI